MQSHASSSPRVDLSRGGMKRVSPAEAVWRAVPGYEGRYEVSNRGDVRSLAGGHRAGRVLVPACTSRGYLSVVLYDGSTPKNPQSRCVHELVAAAFLGPKPAHKEINHKNGDKRHNFDSNLEYMTGAENHAHALEHGLRHVARGVEMPQAKLSDRQVAIVRELRSGAKPTLSRLAILTGVHKTTIGEAASGKSWRHVETDGATV